MSDKTKSILLRFAKGAVAGAITTMCLVTYEMPKTWLELTQIINALSLAGVFGGGVGLLMALQKWASWKN